MTLDSGKEAKLRARIPGPPIIDVSAFRKIGEHYVLDEFVENSDYRDLRTGYWIWTVGEALHNLVYQSTDMRVVSFVPRGIILASTSPVFYRNEHFKCLWIR